MLEAGMATAVAAAVRVEEEMAAEMAKKVAAADEEARRKAPLRRPLAPPPPPQQEDERKKEEFAAAVDRELAAQLAVAVRPALVTALAELLAMGAPRCLPPRLRQQRPQRFSG